MTITKRDVNALRDAGLTCEAFQHETLGWFDIDALRKLVRLWNDKKDGRLIRAVTTFESMKMVDDVERDAYEFLIANREIDRDVVAGLTFQQVNEPLLFLMCPPGTNGHGASQLLVDGIHRLVARKERGYPDFRWYGVPLEDAPRVDPRRFINLDWGNKEVVPGVGLVDRRKV